MDIRLLKKYIIGRWTYDKDKKVEFKKDGKVFFRENESEYVIDKADKQIFIHFPTRNRQWIILETIQPDKIKIEIIVFGESPGRGKECVLTRH